jgi:hypothetical protein
MYSQYTARQPYYLLIARTAGSSRFSGPKLGLLIVLRVPAAVKISGNKPAVETVDTNLGPTILEKWMAQVRPRQ